MDSEKQIKEIIELLIKDKHLRCARCGYEWFPRKVEPRKCPRCKSPYWDRERKSTNESEN